MEITGLTVERRPNYDSEFPNQLVGMIELKGKDSIQKIKLSNKALADVFKVIAAEVQATAHFNASQVGKGIDNAINAHLVVEASKVEALNG